MTGKNATECLQADEAGIARAVQILEGIDLVAVPTETVYGLAARADSAEAVAKIYATKGRPDFNPLIVHVSSIEMAREVALLDARALDLAERFWPGPLTMVLPLRADAPIARAVTAGLQTIAVRQPAHPVARAIIDQLGRPIAAPSANRSYGLSPTRPEHVRASLGEKCPTIIDSGSCESGLESTIVVLDSSGGWRLLRPGPISKETLAGMMGQEDLRSSEAIEAPGQLERHYSPGKPLHLHRTRPEPGDFMIGFGDIDGDVNLSPRGDKVEAAARLYDCLHMAAASERAGISVAPIDPQGIGKAINDRLKRAAA